MKLSTIQKQNIHVEVSALNVRAEAEAIGSGDCVFMVGSESTMMDGLAIFRFHHWRFRNRRYVAVGKSNEMDNASQTLDL